MYISPLSRRRSPTLTIVTWKTITPWKILTRGKVSVRARRMLTWNNWLRNVRAPGWVVVVSTLSSRVERCTVLNQASLLTTQYTTCQKGPAQSATLALNIVDCSRCCKLYSGRVWRMQCQVSFKDITRSNCRRYSPVMYQGICSVTQLTAAPLKVHNILLWGRLPSIQLLCSLRIRFSNNCNRMSGSLVMCLTSNSSKLAFSNYVLITGAYCLYSYLGLD